MSVEAKKIFAGVSSALALSAGATACGTRVEGSGVNPRGNQLEKVAQRILALVDHSPTKYDDKTKNAFGLTAVTPEGATVRYSVQTTPPSQPERESVLIEVQQTGPKVTNFDLSFHSEDDGTWTVNCNNSSRGSRRTLSERNEQVVDLNGKIHDNDATSAHTLLDDEIGNLGHIVNAAEHFLPGEVPAIVDVCHVNIG